MERLKVSKELQDRISEAFQEGRSRSKPIEIIFRSIISPLFTFTHKDANWWQRFQFRFITVEDAENHIRECDECKEALGYLSIRLKNLSR